MEEEIKQFVVIGGIVILFIFCIIALTGFYTVGNGERSVVLTFGNPSNTVYSEGLHYRIPFVQKVEIFDTKTQTLKFDNVNRQGTDSEYTSMFAASKDLQDVQVAIVINYKLKESDVLKTFKSYGSQHIYQSNVVEPIIREVVKSVSSRYTAEELVTKRTQYSKDVEVTLSEVLLTKSSMLEKFNVVNFEFSKSFSDAIELKVTAEQNALTSKNKLEQIKFEAEQNVATAEGLKKAKILNAEAENEAKILDAKANAESIRLIDEQLRKSPQYIEYYKLQKWNGALPKVTGGSSTLVSVDTN